MQGLSPHFPLFYTIYTFYTVKNKKLTINNGRWRL